MTTAPNPIAPGVEAGTPLRMHRQMVAIRLFEERVNDLYTRALMPGLAHLYIGEEADRRRHLRSAAAQTTTSPARTAATAIAWPRAQSPRPDVRGAARQGSRLLQGQGRLDAHRGSRPRATSARTPSSAAAPASRPARRSPRSPSKTGSRRRLLLRRGRARPGRAVRSDEPRAALEAAGDLRLREQRATTSTRTYSESTAGDVAARPAAFGMPLKRSTARTCAAVYAAASTNRRPGAPRRRPGVSVAATPTAITATMSATSRANTTGRRHEEQEWMAERDPSRCTVSG